MSSTCDTIFSYTIGWISNQYDGFLIFNHICCTSYSDAEVMQQHVQYWNRPLGPRMEGWELWVWCVETVRNSRSVISMTTDLLCWGVTTRQPLWVILCRLPEKGRRQIEEIVEEMKERDREERETGTKWRNRRNDNIPPLPLPATRIAGLAQL